MLHPVRLSLFAAVCAAAVLGGRPARADITAEVGGRIGYASTPIRGGVTPFGTGFGGRVGASFSGFYAGVTLVDYLGGSDFGGLSDRSLLYGVELGYGFQVVSAGSTTFTLRPQLGIGNAAISHTDPSQRVDVVTSASGSSASDTTTVNSLYVQPGLVALLSFGRLFVAASGTMLVLPSISYGGGQGETWVAYGAEGQVGFKF